MKIGCVIYAVGDVYEWISECAVKSFKKYHPDIKVHHITNENFNTFKVAKGFETKFNGRHEIYRWAVALEIWKEKQYDKVIMLGADTITCARLTEFTDNNECDVVLTLDDPYQISIDAVPRDTKTGEFITSMPIREIYTPLVLVDGERTHIIPGGQTGDYVIQAEAENSNAELEYTHCNSDVVCFNNVSCLKYLIEYYFRYMKDYKFMEERIKTITGSPPANLPAESSWEAEGKACYGEQGVLNLLVALSLCEGLLEYSQNAEIYGYKNLLNYNVKIADEIACQSDGGVIYNTRSYRSKKWADQWNKTFMEEGINSKTDHSLSLREFKVKNKKLYTVDGHQIKVWHYGHGILSEADPRKHVAKFMSENFNNQTVVFFQRECDCGEFFENLPVA